MSLKPFLTPSSSPWTKTSSPCKIIGLTVLRFHQVVDLIAQIAKKSLNKEDTIIKKIKKLKKLVNEYPNE